MRGGLSKQVSERHSNLDNNGGSLWIESIPFRRCSQVVTGPRGLVITHYLVSLLI